MEQLLSGEPDQHEAQKRALFQRHVAEFPTWARELRGGASVCLYGWGSKRELLTEFAITYLVPQGAKREPVAAKGMSPENQLAFNVEFCSAAAPYSMSDQVHKKLVVCILHVRPRRSVCR